MNMTQQRDRPTKDHPTTAMLFDIINW